MMDTKEDLLLWFINFLIKSPLGFQINLYQKVVSLVIRLNKIYNQLKNYRKENFILDLEIFSKYAWVVPLKGKKVLVLLMRFKKYQMIQIENQIKYGLITEVNFAIILLKNG